MSTEHNVITDPEIHEPKGVAVALAGQSYVANGAGSGSWENLTGNKFITVNVEADFPAASGGVITTAEDTIYVLADDVTTSNRFLMLNGSKITGFNSGGVTLTYTGTGTMFTWVDADGSLADIALDCPNGTLLSGTDTVGGVHTLVLNGVRVASCVTIGTLSNYRFLGSQSSEFADVTNGLALSGANWAAITFNRSSITSTSASFVGIDLGTMVTPFLRAEGLLVNAPAGAIGLKGAAANANISSGSIATVTDSTFVGGITPLSGITPDDIRWRFEGNSPNVPNTMPDALISLTSNATPTILSVGVPTLVLGTWVCERESHFSCTTAGRATYMGERDLTTPIDISIVIDMVSGTNKSVRGYVAVNGVEITNSGKSVNISSGDPKELSMPWQKSLVTTDYIEVFIENETDSVNALVVDATIRVR